MPKYTVSGDLLHPFVIEVEAESRDAAFDVAEKVVSDAFKDYVTKNPGVSIDYAEEIKKDGDPDPDSK